MRVLLVSHRYPPKHAAGTELYTAQLAAGLRARGHEPTVFTAEKDIAARDFTLREREHEGVRVLELVNNLHHEDPRATWRLPEAEERFARVLAELEPDVVHVHHLLHLSLGLPALARDAGAAVVMTLHDYWLQCARFGQRVHADGSVCDRIDLERCAACLSRFKFAQTASERRLAGWIAGVKSATGIDLGPAARGARRALPRKGAAEAFRPDPAGEALWRERLPERDRAVRERLAPAVDRFLAPSAFLRERFVEWGLPPERTLHLPTGVDLAAFDARPRTPRGDVLRVAFLGSLIPAKGPDLLLEAWARLSDAQRARARLDVHGPPAQPEFAQRLERLAAESGAHLAGPIPRAEVPALLARTDLLVVPSVWYENAPLVILEALAARTPLAVARLGGMAELVREGEHGAHFAAGDAADLARVLGELVDAPERLDAFHRGDARPPTLDEMHDAIVRVYDAVRAERSARR